MNKSSRFALLSLFAAPMALADVTFNVQFEPGSKWFTESWSTAARTEMLAFLTDVGKLFRSDSSATINVTDDAVSPFAASAGSDWSTPTAIPGRVGIYRAPALWSIIVKGIDTNGPGADAHINWNMDLSGYGGDSGRLIGNIRGLGRHEMHHAFGVAGSMGHSTTSDPRGTTISPGILESLARDLNDAPLLGAYNEQTGRFTVNNYAVAPDWPNMPMQTGLYIEARNLRGEVAKMPFYSTSTYIDFSHLVGISYISDHPA